MRAYKLIISDYKSSAGPIGSSIGSIASGITSIAGGNGFIIEQNASNPTAPMISFNIQHYADASLTTNNDIYLYNMPDYFYGQYASLFNKRVQLYAGYYDSALMNKINYKPSLGLILQGYITSVIPDYTSIDKPIQLVIQPFPAYQDTATGVKEFTRASRYYTLTIKKKTNPIPMIALAFSKLTNGALTLNTAGVLPFFSQVQIDAPIFNLYDLITICQQQYGLLIAEGVNGFYLANQPKSVAANIGFNLGKVTLLQPSDFLIQPSMINISTLMLKLYMRASIKVLDRVILPPNMFVGLQALSDWRVMSATNMFKGKGIYTLFNGTLQVIKVWYVGDLRNQVEDAWAVNLEVVKI